MLLLFLDQILTDVQKHKGHTIIRKQHCERCSTVLAVEITDKLGRRLGEEYVVKDVLITKRGTDALYTKEAWFGNKVVCPQCRVLVTLPMDKPLNAENIALPKEVKDGKNKDHVSTQAG